MYAGHLAAGMALKAKEPKAPTWALLIGVGLLDILFGPFVLLGIEHASLTPESAPGFSLDYIDWSHSFAMSLLWSVLFAMAFWKLGRAVATIIGASVFSHFVLDLPMHPPDMALWPNASVHLGFGLWQKLPHGWWFVELAVIAAAWAYYLRKSRRSQTFGGRPIAVGVVIMLFHVMNAPWFAAYN